MIYKVIIVIIFSLFASCKSQDNRQKIIDKSYEDFKRKISGDILDNFPITITGDSTYPILLFPEILRHNHIYCGVFIVYNLSATLFDFEYKKITNNKLYIGKIKKSEIIQLKGLNNGINYTGYKNNVIQKKYIVPDYSASYDPLLKEVFPGEFETVLIDERMGKFLPEEFFEEDNLLPVEYKHGYSKGIFLDEKKIKNNLLADNMVITMES